MSDKAVIDRLSTEIDNLANERDGLLTKLASLEGERDGWTDEAAKWAKMYAEYRQAAEARERALTHDMRQWAQWGLGLRSLMLPLWCWALLMTVGAMALWLGWIPTRAY